MSTMYTIKVMKRETAQKSFAKNIVKGGGALATLYGRDKQFSLSLNLRDFEKVFVEAGQHDIITLDIDGEAKHEVMVKDYQIDGIKRTIRHIDFYEIDRNKKIKTFIPLHLTGTPEGVRLGGGTLEQVEYEIPVKAFPGSIPKEIVLDVTNLKVGNSLHVSDVVFPEGVEAVGDKSKALVTVVVTEEDTAKATEGAAVEAK